MSFEKQMTPIERAYSILQRIGLTAFEKREKRFDWSTVAGVAMDFSGNDGVAVDYNDLADEFLADIEKVAPMVSEYSGLDGASARAPAAVVGRREWIALTSQSLEPMVEPLLASFIRPDSAGWRRFFSMRLAQTALTAEIGIALGYISSRVLGQYDPGLTAEEEAPGHYLFVYPNISIASERLCVKPREFRLWLVLHEVTHGLEFAANPWLKPYLRELIKDNTGYITEKIKRMLPDKVERAGVWADPFGMLTSSKMRGLILPEENPFLARAQAIMTVLEGYSEYIMAGVAEQMFSGDVEIGSLMERSREQRNLFHRLIGRLIGLDAKIRQYYQGRRFIERIADVGGMRLVNRLWEGPQNIPTLTELSRPELWALRMMRD